MNSGIVKLAASTNGQWVKRWSVPSESNPSKSYVVAQNREGEFGCSCPVWIFRRKECKHIRNVLTDAMSTTPIIKSVDISPTEQPVSIKDLSQAAFVVV